MKLIFLNHIKKQNSKLTIALYNYIQFLKTSTKKIAGNTRKYLLSRWEHYDSFSSSLV